MKSSYVLLAFSPAVALLACSGSKSEPVGTGGSSGGAFSSGGSQPAGGQSTSGGAPSGGAPTGGGPSGGALSGGAASGGSASGGKDDGAGGDMSGAGGATASSGGSAASGGSGSGGAPEVLEPKDLVGLLDGFLYRGECDGGAASFECPLVDCSGGVLDKQVSFDVAGTPGVFYEITMHVFGVVELRSDYKGGTRRQGTKSNAQSNHDFFYEGGSYTAGAGYNVYGISVEPAVPMIPATGSKNLYFLNARDSSPEGHEVYALDYEATVVVGANSKLTFQAYDPNCLQIMNNSETVRPTGSGTGPNGAIVLDQVEDADPPPENFTQPLSSGGRTGQWIFIDVLRVAARAA